MLIFFLKFRKCAVHMGYYCALPNVMQQNNRFIVYTIHYYTQFRLSINCLVCNIYYIKCFVWTIKQFLEHKCRRACAQTTAHVWTICEYLTNRLSRDPISKIAHYNQLVMRVFNLSLRNDVFGSFDTYNIGTTLVVILIYDVSVCVCLDQKLNGR